MASDKTSSGAHPRGQMAAVVGGPGVSPGCGDDTVGNTAATPAKQHPRARPRPPGAARNTAAVVRGGFVFCLVLWRLAVNGHRVGKAFEIAQAQLIVEICRCCWGEHLGLRSLAARAPQHAHTALAIWRNRCNDKFWTRRGACRVATSRVASHLFGHSQPAGFDAAKPGRRATACHGL